MLDKLSNQPIYLMSLFNIPKVIAESWKQSKGILVGEKDMQRKSHQVLTMLSTEKRGRLRHKNLMIVSHALLTKHSWKFAIETRALLNSLVR